MFVILSEHMIFFFTKTKIFISIKSLHICQKKKNTKTKVSIDMSKNVQVNLIKII